MRILYIVTAFPRWPGDVITPWLSETIERLAARGVEVEVLAPAYRGILDQEVQGVRVHRFRYAPARWETLTHEQTAPDRIRDRPAFLALVPGYVAAGSVAAARLARSGRFDVLHAFWPLPHGVLSLAARRFSGVPVVSTFFGVELRWLRRDLPFLTPVVRRIVRRSDAVTVISSHTEREVRALVPDAQVVRIPFGAAVSSSQRAATAWQPEAAVVGPFRFLFVGRLVERKGVSVLLGALARLRAEREVELTVVGEGPLLSPLKAEAERLGVAGIVTFAGFVPEEELSRRFEESHAFVLPAVEDAKGDVEGLGVVLLEALQHDRPVIASASGGIPDIVVDGESGLLVPPGDEEALAGAMRRLIDDASLRHSLVEGGHRHVADQFSWGRIADDLVALYGKVTGQRVGVRAGGEGS